MTVILVTAPSVRSACTLARRHLGMSLADAREKYRTGPQNGSYRVVCAGDLTVEVQIVRHRPANILSCEPPRDHAAILRRLKEAARAGTNEWSLRLVYMDEDVDAVLQEIAECE